MSAGSEAVREAPLELVLSLLAPKRIVLLGPEGPTLRAGLEWAIATPGATIRRQADAAGSSIGDLLVSEQATLLPQQGGTEVAVLLPVTQLEPALAGGWELIARTAERHALLRRQGASSFALEPTLDSYARLRLAASQRLMGLRNGVADAPGQAAGPHHEPVVLTSVLGPAAAPPRPGPAVSIVIPVFNAPKELRRCLLSLARHTTWPAELLIVDDASTDPEIPGILAAAAEIAGVRMLRNALNAGFTATVNRALRATAGDVVLLNSDTEVGPRWLEHLVQAARTNPAVATVTAVSDNAGAFAFPVSGHENPTPWSLDLAGVARLLAQRPLRRVQTPTGSGFCLYVRRVAIDALGGFDEEAFPRGYGEENDFCLRALRAGWSHLLDGRTFVHHVRKASFGEERTPLERVARMRLDERYPEYTELVREFVGGEQIAELRAGVQAAYDGASAPRPRILFVIHEGGGGTWIANLELMRALQPEWEPYVLTSDRQTLRLWRLQAGERDPVREWTLQRPIRVTDFSRLDYEAIVREVLSEYEIELVHVRHLFKHTFDAPRVAGQLGVPVVFSFHDFYFTCPTVNLLDDKDTYCAAQCTPGDGDCRVPDAGLDGLPHLKHTFVHQWREEVETMLGDVDAFVTSSEHAREVHTRALRTLGGRPFEVIEHGRTLRQRAGIAAPPRPGDRVRILVVANLDVHKGAEYLRAVLAADTDRRLELHLLGSVPEAYADLGVRHGAFEAEDLPERAAGIGPAFAGCFSIAAETYSHSLTEAWAMGLPVVATDIGAVAERIRAHGGGQLLPLDDPAEAVRRICAVADDPTGYARLREQATLRGTATVADMADAYAALYRRVLDGRRVLVPRPGGRGPAHLRHGVARLLAVVSGADGVHPGSTYVRIVQRYRHPGVSWKLSLALRYADHEPLRVPADLVLVQRTALHPSQTESFLSALYQLQAPLLLDLDDHLLIKGSADADYGHHQESLAALVDAARLVLVSTEKLARALTGSARQVALVPNLLDERLFLSGVHARPMGGPGERPLQIVYIGSPTHHLDLAMMRSVLARLAERQPGSFELNVVGGERPGADQEWYRRVVVPDRCKPYPEFVRWLRGQRPQWDIAVAPLCDDEFNSYKSDLKYLEYAALGLPAIFSDREPYATVEHGRTGLKVPDDVEDWIGALNALREDPSKRERLADAAFEQVVSTRLMLDGADDLLRLICSL